MSASRRTTDRPRVTSSAEHPPHRLGRRGERLAERHLVARGWRVLARNHRFGRREVDLVVERDRLIVFVEVKTRAGEGYGDPLEAVTLLKRREIEVVAERYLASHPGPWTGVRFDAVSIVAPPGGPVRLEHVEDAWRPGWR